MGVILNLGLMTYLFRYKKSVVLVATDFFMEILDKEKINLKMHSGNQLPGCKFL